MDAADKRMLEREALRNMIQQWNANRLDLFELSEPNENLEFHGVMRFYFQDSGQKIATKCIRVASDATVSDVIETLIEKFRPDMRMLSLGSYSLWETHGPDDERRLEPHEKPLLVQLNWHADDREGRFLLKCTTNADTSLSSVNEKGDQNFKRKLSKREKKELKKKEKLSRLKSDSNNENRPVAEKLYTELPETSFTRSISNPEAVMRRRRQQKLERKLQQFRSKDGGPDTGGTLKIYGSSLCPDVPYKTLLLSVGDTAAGVVREMLDKYGLSRHDPQHFCIVSVVHTLWRHGATRRRASCARCSTSNCRYTRCGCDHTAAAVGDSAAGVVREMLDKYGLSRHDPQHFCIVQVTVATHAVAVTTLLLPSATRRRASCARCSTSNCRYTRCGCDHTAAAVGDTAAGVVREMLDKYGLSRHDPQHFCIVQVDATDNSESILEDDECPLAIVMTHPHRSSIMFHVRRRPAESQPRRRKKKTAGCGAGCGAGGSSARPGCEPVLVELAPDGAALENGRRVRITGDMLEVGSGNGTALQLYGPSIQPRHCVVASGEAGGYIVTPLHADAHVYVNGRRAVAPHSLPLQHGCLLKFGRVSTFRFVDPNQENLLNRNLSQSQHFGSGSIYDRSPEARVTSPTSADAADDYRPMSPDRYSPYRDANDTLTPYNNNTLKLDNDSVVSHLNDSKEDYLRDDHTPSIYDQDSQSRTNNSQYKDNYETTFDLDGNVETKSICSAKSGGSGHDNRMSATVGSAARPGQEAILPAVLEFPEAGQAQFLAAVITRLDPHAPAFKLAPVYTLYLCARYRASTHYRPELTPTERAHKLTAFLHHVATLIHATVQERCTDSAAQAFWMANASELLHFLKCDRHISSFSTQAQELLPATVQNAFSNLVSCFQEELSRALGTLTNPALTDATEATAPTLQALAAAMVLLRRCRVNAALTIQLFSHLFHYINAVCFNKLVTEPGTVSARWGSALAARLALLAAWAERQGLELPADCHLARTHQAARLISGTYRTAEEVRAALAACFKLNSVQVRALLTPLAPPDVVDAAAHHARALADELCRADGREITLEESSWLGVGLLIPGDGFSAEVVRGVPPGLAEFVAPLQRGALCRLAHQPHARGVWTVYMAGYGAITRRPPDPAVHIIQLNKNSNGMGLSIVAAKGAGQSKLGIYIKSVVPGGAAAADARLAAGDQLLSVDGQSLVGITQEKAAEYLVRTGPTVTLEVAKQGAVLHGLATLLHQPAYNNKQGYRRQCHDRCHPLRDESTESSTSESEECVPHYHGSIPRLIITLDRENNQLRDDLSPDTPGCPLELKGPPPPRPIPIFTFTCEDFDEQRPASDSTYDSHVPEPVPPPAPAPAPAEMPPQMRPIDTRLTLELFRDERPAFRRRCTVPDECVSACECCRVPQPEAPQIPYIDEPAFEPFIFEEARVATPKTRRILPSVSLDRPDDKPETADAVCQTPSFPMDVDEKDLPAPRTPQSRKLELKLDVSKDADKIDDIHCRLRRALFTMSKSYSSKSEGAAEPSNSTSESFDDTINHKNIFGRKNYPTPVEAGAKQVLDSVDRKSWKSPDEYRPAFGRVKALTKRFNDINLRYCVKNYKRNCQSSPNLSCQTEKTFKSKENLPASSSLVDIQYESLITDTSETKGEKMSEDEVKSILIQLEDWSRYGSRGSEDTLAQGNEFELPNLPSEDHSDNHAYVFNEIIHNKPKLITLENIRLKSNQSSLNSDTRQSKESLKSSAESSSKAAVVEDVTQKSSFSLLDVSSGSSPSASCSAVAQSWPNLSGGSARGRTALAAPARRSCPATAAAPPCPLGAARRASERDLPARLAAEPVKPSKSTPALHHADAPADTMPPLPASVNMHPVSASVANVNQVGASGAAASAWAGKSRSSHNLAQPQDGFYQNLPAHQHHNLHDRWSSLRSSTGSNRPQSAHYAPAPLETSPDSPQQHQQNQMNAISARSAKLAEMSEEVTRRQQMQYQLAQQKAATLPAHHNMMSPHHHYPNQLNIHPNMQPPMSPNMQQPMSPNMQSPMSPNMQQSMQAMQQNMQPPMSPNMQQAMSPNMQPPMSPNMQQSMQAMQLNMQANMQGMQGNMQGMQGNLHQQHQHMQSPPPQQLYHNQHQPQQRYEWHPPGPPSPQRAQPPVAPKPQGVRRPESELEEQYHQHNQQPQQSTIQPDDERYVASALEPPPGPAGPYQARGPSRPGAPAADNPWQREERERQQEQRRAQARTRRDAAIASLLAIGSARTPAQNQQLRALQLEREFERRATQHAEDGAADAVESDPEPEQPERAPAPPAPPKSILKTNNTPRTDHTNGYAHDTSGATPGAAEAAEALGALALAPPPPERGSSFAVMATRARALSPPHHAPQPHQPPPHQHTPQYVVITRPPRRAAGATSACRSTSARRPQPRPRSPRAPASSPPPLHDAPPHEDPDRFIEEAESMLAGGLSPSTPTTASVHTPGVIGAQEVYRDPRQRRLAEKQAATSAAPVPEQLSFKEKMKMFALEAGDPNTPKDKVKISRAQRDIDAVH
ncbi:uncharacterized protein LOC125226430 [Leguminivora glycinivorella]|nr:uncharacterized protein LOC125226430 [Leguminivora glycinivorella]